jgi:serine/threonine-protein kinase
VSDAPKPGAAPAPDPLAARLDRVEAPAPPSSGLELDTSRAAPAPSEPSVPGPGFVRPWADRPSPPRTGRRVGLILVGLLVVAGVLALTAPALIPGLGGAGPTGVRAHGLLEDALGRAAAPAPLVVLCEPDGATVKVGGKIVGTCPWAGENTWTGPVEVEVTLPGYQPWRHTVAAGAEAHLTAKLVRR